MRRWGYFCWMEEMLERRVGEWWRGHKLPKIFSSFSEGGWAAKDQ